MMQTKPMPMPGTWTAALLTAATLTACAGNPAPNLSPEEACLRTSLDPGPLRAASFTWRPGGGIALVDLGGQELMLYAPDGTLERQVGGQEGHPIHGLDYTNPIALRPAPEGYTLRDRSYLLRLDADFQVMQTLQPLEGETSAGILGDAITVGDTLVGYLDLQASEDPEAPWERGFARVDLSRPGDPEAVHFLLSMPLERDGEYERYYHYDVRPYVAARGGTVFFLRLTETPQLVRATRDGIRTVAPLRLPAKARAVALHSWEEWLFLLVQSVVPSRNTDPFTRIVERTDPEWFLMQLDPARGDILRTVQLPTRARRLQLAPGTPHWAALEESSEPNLDGTRPAQLLTFDARLLRNGNPTEGDPPTLCPHLLPHEGEQ
jgi:hypothetical protein